VIAWLAVAVALGSEASTVQRIHELEWSRADPLNLAAQIPGGDTETRAEAARALGRLRDPNALLVLEGLRTDPDPEVQVAVAHALAWTPGSAELVRTWLGELGPPGRAASTAATRRYVALTEALGRQGTARDLQLVLAALREPWPVGAAAARALGTMATRKVAAVDEAVPALIARLRAPDPRVVGDVAWALQRIGLQRAAAVDVAAVRDRFRRGTTPEVQAMLLVTLWPQLDADERNELFLDAATDNARGLRVAVLQALRPGDVPADVVSTFLADPDPWVRQATIRALARDESPEATQALGRHAADAGDPWEAASTLAALGLADDGRARETSEAAPIRAALTRLVADREALVGLALDDEEAMVRSAAAEALLADEAAGPREGEELLASPDAAVREEAVALLSRGEPRAVGAALLPHLRVESHHAVLAAGLEALTAAVRLDRRAVDPADRYLPTVLKRAAQAPSVRARVAAEDLARELALEPPSSAAAASRELVLPSGEALTVDGGAPAVQEVRRIRGARIETSQGDFVVELDPDVAPLAVSNFAALAETGFYDDLVFHRVEPGYVAQTGCPRGDGWGGPGWTIPDEISSEPFDAGAVGMARGAEDSGGSQWFVVTGDQPQLSGSYTRFGRVVQGMHVVKRLEPGSRILSVTIERIEPEPGR
jgi:cyclophilin family peptidyl-prolyl cis-trans isomerase/HEAT repeat protein